MLSFAAEFPINPACTTADFLKAVKSWLLASPHTEFVSNDLSEAPQDGNWTVLKKNEKLEALLFSSTGEEAAAVKHTKVDGAISWETTIVFSRKETDAWVGVRTSRESSHPATRLPPAKKPIVVRTLLEELGGASDGKLLVTSAARHLTNNDIDLAAKLISGEAGCHLPVIYVSCGFDGRHVLDLNSIANDLSGMAHVVSEPNRAFSQRLQIEVNSENVYGGVVGIYWPNGQGRRSFFLGREFDDSTTLKKAIIEEIRTALMNRRPLVRCTWSAVEEASSRVAYNALKESGSIEIERYIEVFDSEMKAKEQIISDAEKEISRLQAEVKKYESKTSLNRDIGLEVGTERDFFPGEISQIVLDALADAQGRVPNDSRRKHVLSAITAQTSASNTAREHREALKELLRAYKNMDAKTRKGLESLGFSISEDGKHFKLLFQNDDRYTFTLSKSGSDHRGGLNAASDISKKMF